MLKKTRILFAVFLVSISPVLLHASSYANSNTEEESNPGEGTIAGKDEVIYANLLASGDIEELYIVNALDITEEGYVTDYGSYEEVKNLTSLSEIEENGDEVQLNVPTGMFYYQGNIRTDTDLPWEFEIEYSLDGEQMEPSELIGRDGEFELVINVEQNDQVDPAFFENYLVQIAIPLHGERFRNIDAADATVASEGKNKQLVFTVMPEEEAELSLTADVTQFEFEGIDISALPSTFAVDPPDTDELTGEMDSLTGAISELTSGMGELNNGLNELASGLSQLEDGSSEYQTGMNEVAASGQELVSASGEIRQGLLDMSEGLQNSEMDIDVDFDMGFDDELLDALEEFSDGISEVSGGMDELGTHFEQAYHALEQSISDIPDSELTEEEIYHLYETHPDSEVVDTLVETYTAAQTVKGTFEAVQEGFTAVKPALDEMSASFDEAGEGLNSFAASLEDMGDMAEAFDVGEIEESMNQLTSGIDELASQYGEFHNGLVAYTNGINELSNSYSNIHSGISESADGASQLDGGMGELHDGMSQLEEATADIPKQMQEEIDEMIAQYDHSDYEARSFVSSENNDVINNVQFVIQTESIKPPEQDDNDEAEEEEPSIWQRFLQLFGWD